MSNKTKAQLQRENLAILNEIETSATEDRTNDGTSPLWLDVDEQDVENLQEHLREFSDKVLGSGIEAIDFADERLVMPIVKAQVLEVNTLENYFKCDLEIEVRFYNHDFVTTMSKGLAVSDLAEFVRDKQELRALSEAEYDREVLIPKYKFYELSKQDMAKENADEILPQITLRNYENARVTFDSVGIHASGMVSIRKNYLATYRELLELQNFPFDRQLLRVEFHLSRALPVEFKFWAYRDENFYETPFTVQEEEDLLQDMAYFGYKAEWKKSTLAGYSTACEITVEVQRTPDFYYRNYLLVYFLLFGLNFMVYFLGVDNASDRLTYQATLLVSIFAFRLSLMAELPKVSYQTYADIYQTINFILVCSWTFTVGLIISPINIQNVFGGDKALASEVDLWVNLVFAIALLAFHIFCVAGGITGHFHISWDSVYANNEPVAAKISERKTNQEPESNLLWFSETRRAVSAHELFGGALNCKKSQTIPEHIVSQFATQPTEYKVDDFMGGAPRGGPLAVSVEM